VPRFTIALLLFTLLSIPSRVVFAQVVEGSPTPTITPTPTPAQLAITSPISGEALQGNVTIQGTTGIEGFSSSELTFTYADSSADTWFLIQESNQPVLNGVLAHWDTTTITDGNYDLRLVVTRAGDERDIYTVSGLRVRNYTQVETGTPTPVTPTSTPLPGDTPIPSETPTPTASPVPPTATPLPANPAELTPGDIRLSLAKGGLAVLGLFAVFGIYQGFKRLGKRDW
jgi:hypothetical protein